MFKITIIGNLGADAEIKQNDRGRFITFSLYHSDKFTDRTTGQIVTEVYRASVTYNSDSTNLAQYLKQGQRVYVRGNYSHRIYTGNDHMQHVGINVRATELEILFDKKEQEQDDPKPFL